jgi:hypothetical protein
MTFMSKSAKNVIGPDQTEFRRMLWAKPWTQIARELGCKPKTLFKKIGILGLAIPSREPRDAKPPDKSTPS